MSKKIVEIRIKKDKNNWLLAGLFKETETGELVAYSRKRGTIPDIHEAKGLPATGRRRSNQKRNELFPGLFDPVPPTRAYVRKPVKPKVKVKATPRILTRRPIMATFGKAPSFKKSEVA